MKRHLHSIDGLRGVFSLLVLTFHCSYWLTLPFYETGVSILRIWGIYAVEGFFIISGIALVLSTSPSRILSIDGSRKFIIRRFARIWPLYVLLFFVSFGMPEFSQRHIFEMSMLFGFYAPEKSSLAGGWSLGVEFIFYFFSRCWYFLLKKACSEPLPLF